MTDQSNRYFLVYSEENQGWGIMDRLNNLLVDHWYFKKDMAQSVVDEFNQEHPEKIGRASGLNSGELIVELRPNQVYMYCALVPVEEREAPSWKEIFSPDE